jgi:hypothetical protein
MPPGNLALRVRWPVKVMLPASISVFNVAKHPNGGHTADEPRVEIDFETGIDVCCGAVWRCLDAA